MELLTDAIPALLAKNLPALLLACLAVVTSALVSWRGLASRLKMRRFPLLAKKYGGKKEEWLAMSAGVFEEGYRSFPGEIHRIATPEGEHVVVPQRYLDELRQRPDDEVDGLTAFMMAFENRYLGLFPGHRKTHIVNSVVKKELTRSLASINHSLSQIVEQTVASELPPCKDWTPVNVHSALMRIVAVVSGYVFIGPELCHREEYLKTAVDFTTDLVMAVPVLKRWHPWLRPLACLVEPTVVKVRAHRRVMRDFLAPVIAARREAKRRGTEKMPEDTLQWILDRCDEEGITDLTDLANMQLLLTMAAIHTTTLTVTFILYDLVTRPEVIDMCRAEIRDVLKEHGGVLTTNALFNLKLVDSVMRESQRMNPPFIDAFRRYTLKQLTLRDGTVIPKGVLLETPNKAVLMDPSLYPSPEKFDPTRFLRLRTSEAERDPMGYRNREQYQFVSVTKENMSFGFGRHACPGRFFAANEIKLILARLLLEYDMKVPPGERGRGNEATALGAGVGPDTAREVLFRRARS